MPKKVTKIAKKENNSCSNIKCGSGCGGCAYFLGVIGSAVYYISVATSFGMGLLGVLKSLVWPAFLIYYLFKFLGA